MRALVLLRCTVRVSREQQHRASNELLSLRQRTANRPAQLRRTSAQSARRRNLSLGVALATGVAVLENHQRSAGITDTITSHGCIICSTVSSACDDCEHREPQQSNRSAKAKSPCGGRISTEANHGNLRCAEHWMDTSQTILFRTSTH